MSRTRRRTPTSAARISRRNKKAAPGEAASRSIAFAEQARRTVHAYVEQTKGPLTLGGAAAYLAEATGRGMGGGACVTALNHLYQMRHTDKRIEALVQGYYCNI